MPLVLFRVDDRLVHGQVVIGWGRPLNIQRIILVDDTVAASEWEQDIYRMAVAEGVEITFADVATATRELPGWDADPRRTILLTGGLEAMSTLHRAHPGIVSRINLGGIHHRPGRVERLPYLYLDPDEKSLIAELRSGGATVTAQDLPTAVGVDGAALS